MAGKIDLIGLAHHEITHALGRVSYSWGTTGFDLYRYSAPGVWSGTNSVQTYFSIDGGVTNLGDFSRTGDPADWDHDHPDDAQSAFLGTGMEFIYSEADIIALNAMGFAIDGAPPASTGAGETTDPLADGSGARLALPPMVATDFMLGFELPSEMGPGIVGAGAGAEHATDVAWHWLVADGDGYF